MANGNISQLKAYDTNKVLKTYDITDSKARSDITDLQNNKVTGPNSSTANHLAVFKDSTGKEIIDGGVITAGEGISVSGNNIINSGVRSISTGDNNGTIKVNTNGTEENVIVQGLGSSAYNDVDYFIKSSDDYINLNPNGDSDPVIIPYLFNEINNLYDKTQSKDTVLFGPCSTEEINGVSTFFSPIYFFDIDSNLDEYKRKYNFYKLFDTSFNYFDFSSINYSKCLYDYSNEDLYSYSLYIELHKSFISQNILYIDFGKYEWSCKKITIEVINTNCPNDVYTTKIDINNNNKNFIKTKISHTPIDEVNHLDGFNKMRITFSDWNSKESRRIYQIGLISNDYSITDDFLNFNYLQKSGGTVNGDLVPFDNNKINLGSLSKYFKNLYTNNINGVNLGNNPEFTDNKVTNTLDNNTKNYLTGTTSDTTNTDEQVFDSGIYSTETPGQLNATTYKINEKAILQYNSDNDCIDFTFI